MRRIYGTAWGKTQLPQKSSLVAQTAAILKERIQSGEWHKWLPGEHELCAHLRVARMTLRGALAQLEQAGMVRARQGKRREILARRRRAAPGGSGRVLLLTPVPLYVMPHLHVFCANELREALEKVGFHFEIHAERGLYGHGSGAGLERLMQQLRPAGCVLVSSTDKMQLWFSRRRLPCVIWGSKHPGVELPSVDKAYRAVCRHAVGLLLARGHRRVALLNPESGAAGDLESEEGFREGVAQHKQQDVEASITRHDGTVGGICNVVAGLLKRRNPPTALLVSRATNVLTVMGYLMRNGFRCPEDVALISRDHEPFLERMVPSVAHYKISPQAMAHRICAAVLERVQTGLVSATDYQIMPEFAAGDTLGSGPISSQVAEK
jgi:DNA-binding LacI/PurR family transcriptional regulator